MTDRPTSESPFTSSDDPLWIDGMPILYEDEVVELYPLLEAKRQTEEQLRAAEARIRALEEEIARLKGQQR